MTVQSWGGRWGGSASESSLWGGLLSNRTSPRNPLWPVVHVGQVGVVEPRALQVQPSCLLLTCRNWSVFQNFKQIRIELHRSNCLDPRSAHKPGSGPGSGPLGGAPVLEGGDEGGVWVGVGGDQLCRRVRMGGGVWVGVGGDKLYRTVGRIST